MLDIANHWGDAHRTHIEIPLTRVRMAITKNKQKNQKSLQQKITSVVKMWRLE